MGRELEAQVVLPGQGERLELGPSHVVVLVGGSTTKDALTLVEEHLPPGPGSPPTHIHRAIDHTFYVTSGSVRFTAGTESVQVEAGGAVFVPRGVPHTFENASRSRDAVFVEFDAPGGFDAYFRELSRLLADEGFAVERIRDLQSRYDTWPPS